MAAEYPDIAKKGVLLRKFGQEVIRVTAGKRIHGTGAIPGGVNKALSADERDPLLADAYQMIGWSREAVALVKRLHFANVGLYNSFGAFRSNMLSLVAADGSLDLYHGGPARPRRRGRHPVRPRRLQALLGPHHRGGEALVLHEVSVSARARARRRAGTRSARWCACRTATRFPTPFADAERREFVDFGGGQPIHATLAYHWARMIEMLFAAEMIKDLLARRRPAGRRPRRDRRTRIGAASA